MELKVLDTDKYNKNDQKYRNYIRKELFETRNEGGYSS